MFKKFGFLLICLSFVLILNAQNTEKATKIPQYIFHTVVFGETLNAIAFKYDVTTVDIMKSNPGMNGSSLMPEQILRIPNKKKIKIEVSSSIPTVLDEKPQVKSTKYDLITIEKGMTLYSISKKYNVDLNDLLKWNDLKTYDVKIGSQIVINPKNKGKEVVAPKPKEIKVQPINKELTPKKQQPDLTPKPKEEIVKSQELKPKNSIKNIDEPTLIDDNQTTITEDIPASIDNESQKELTKIFKSYKESNRTITNIKGTGAPMTTSLGTVENTYFIMHRSLPIGTVIKIKNLVNSKTVYGKVIGKLPDTQENKNVVIRYSLGVKKDLILQNGKNYLQIEFPE